MGSKESIALEDDLDLNADLDNELDNELDGADLDANDLGESIRNRCTSIQFKTCTNDIFCYGKPKPN